MNEVYEGTAVPEVFLEKQKNYHENVLSTNDAVEWSLNEDAVECIRSQHFEIFVRRPYKDSQQKRKKKRKKVSEIKFLSRCKLRVELKVRRESTSTCFLIASASIPLNSLLDSTWMKMTIKQNGKNGPKNSSSKTKTENVEGFKVKSKRAVRSTFTNLSDCYPWKYPINIKTINGKNIENSKSHSTNEQTSTGAKHEETTPGDSNISSETAKFSKKCRAVATALHTYVNHPNEARLLLKGGVNDEHLKGQIDFITPHWLQDTHELVDGTECSGFALTLMHEKARSVKHTFIDDSTQQAMIKGVHLYKVHDKSISFDYMETPQLKSSISFHLLYKSCVDVSVGLHADENNIEEDFKRKFSLNLTMVKKLVSN